MSSVRKSKNVWVSPVFLLSQLPGCYHQTSTETNRCSDFLLTKIPEPNSAAKRTAYMLFMAAIHLWDWSGSVIFYWRRDWRAGYHTLSTPVQLGFLSKSNFVCRWLILQLQPFFLLHFISLAAARYNGFFLTLTTVWASGVIDRLHYVWHSGRANAIKQSFFKTASDKSEHSGTNTCINWCLIFLSN